MPIERTTRRHAAVVLLLAALATAPYVNALSAGFTFDDEPQILTNTAVTEGLDPVRVLTAPLYPGDLYRPLTVFTFAINQALTPGEPFLFHAINVWLHICVVLALRSLADRVFHVRRVAVIAAALFAVHPIHTEAVTSLVGRAELLAALFGLLTLLAVDSMDHVARGLRRSLLLALAIVCFSLALLSKESALTILPLIPLLRIVRRGDSLLLGLRRELRSLDWVPFALCTGLFLVLRFYVVGALHAYGTVTPLDNVLAFVPSVVRMRSALGVVWDYFGLLNVPLALAADYSYAQVSMSRTWLDPRFLAGLTLLVVGCIAFVRYSKSPIGFAIALALVTMLLTSNLLFAIGTVKAERLLYLPSIGWALLVAYAFDRLLAMRDHKRPALMVLAVVMVTFAARTWLRNGDWQSDSTLYRDMAYTAPNSAKSLYNFGVDLKRQEEYSAAEVQYRRALAIYPWSEGAALGIGITFEKRGFVDAAVKWYEKSLNIMPSYHEGYTNLCHALIQRGRFEEAAAACRRGLRYYPSDANLLKGFGASLVAIGAAEKGVEVLRRSLILNARDNELRVYLARLTTSTGNAEEVAVQ